MPSATIKLQANKTDIEVRVYDSTMTQVRIQNFAGNSASPTGPVDDAYLQAEEWLDNNYPNAQREVDQEVFEYGA